MRYTERTIIRMKIIYVKEILNIISAYTPQVGIEESIKKILRESRWYGAKYTSEWEILNEHIGIYNGGY